MADLVKHHYQPVDSAFLESMRARIKTATHLDTLQAHAIDPRANPITETQFKAIELLLKKSLPNLHSTEITVSDRPVSERSQLIDRLLQQAAANKHRAERIIDGTATRVLNSRSSADPKH